MYDLKPNKSPLNAVHDVLFPSVLFLLPDLLANCIIKLDLLYSTLWMQFHMQYCFIVIFIFYFSNSSFQSEFLKLNSVQCSDIFINKICWPFYLFTFSLCSVSITERVINI